MSAKPYTDAEIDAWRVYVAACASATEIPASARDSVRALFRLSLPSDYHARWLATVDALQSRLAAAESRAASATAEAERAAGLLRRARRLLHEPSMFGREKLDACVERIDAHLASRPEGEVRHG